MLLDVRDVTKKFGGLVAVSNLSFSVDNGEILGIIGPNGAGKTTVLNMISGFSPATSGSIHFEENDITGLKANKIAGLGIGRNFQNSALFMTLSPADNCFSAFHLHYQSPWWKRLMRFPSAIREEKDFRHEGEQILENMGLGPVKHDTTRNLPYGYQRILGVCIALATRPKLLLLDEPLTGMNETEINNMVHLIREIRDMGITIVMIEHNVGAIMSICDRIIVLNYGQKIAEGRPEEIQTNEQVIEAYLGKDD